MRANNGRTEFHTGRDDRDDGASGRAWRTAIERAKAAVEEEFDTPEDFWETFDLALENALAR